MATSSRQSFGMPGLYTPDRLDGRPSSETEMFAPAPRFPAAATANISHVIDSTALTAHETRKRHRVDGCDTDTSTPQRLTTNVWADSSASLSRFSNAKSPPPLANDRYQLAGGMEKPDMSTRHTGNYDDYFQLEKQRGMWTPSVHSSGPRNQLSTDSAASTPNGSKPWVLNQIINLVGGVAGTLVQFCSRPFRGFQAGGGQGYTFGTDGEITAADADPFVNDAPEAAPVQSLLPGGFPEDSYGVRSIESLEAERLRMPKRLRTGENWVMVGQDGAIDSRPSTPRVYDRRLPARTNSPSQIPRPVGRTSTNSATPKRPSLIPVSRRSTIDRKPLTESSPMSPKPYKTSRTYNRQSYGSPVMFRDTATTKKSPLPPESHQLINRMRREELEDEARLRRMSSQMSQMLREAQEALGSKFEAEGDYS